MREYQIVVEENGKETIIFKAPYVLFNGDVIVEGLRSAGKYAKVYERGVEVSDEQNTHV